MHKRITEITKTKNFLTLSVKEHVYTDPRLLLLHKTKRFSDYNGLTKHRVKVMM